MKKPPSALASMFVRARENYNDMIINSATYRHWYTHTHSRSHTYTAEGVNRVWGSRYDDDDFNYDNDDNNNENDNRDDDVDDDVVIAAAAAAASASSDVSNSNRMARARLNVCPYPIITTYKIYIFILSVIVYTLSTFAFQLKNTHTIIRSSLIHAACNKFTDKNSLLYMQTKRHTTHTTHSRPSTVLCFYFFFFVLLLLLLLLFLLLLFLAVDCFQHTHMLRNRE